MTTTKMWNDYDLGTDLSPKFLMGLLDSFWHFLATRGVSEEYEQSKWVEATVFHNTEGTEEAETYRMTLVENAGPAGGYAACTLEIKPEGSRKIVFEIEDDGAVTRSPRGSKDSIMEDLLAVLLITPGNRYGKAPAKK